MPSKPSTFAFWELLPCAPVVGGAAAGAVGCVAVGCAGAAVAGLVGAAVGRPGVGCCAHTSGLAKNKKIVVERSFTLDYRQL